MQKKILITGFTGMLGQSIVKKLAQRSNFQLYGIARNENKKLDNVQQIVGDLMLPNFIKSLQFVNPDIIIHTSALVNLNLCQTENQLAERANIEAGKSLATLFPEAHFIYISTDAVFDGTKGNYSEDMDTNPVNYYAYTKRAGEAAIQAVSKHALILRTNIYGHKNNKKSLFDWAYEQLKQGQSINGFEDVFFNPLYTEQVAEIIDKIITDYPLTTGIFHLGSQEKLNKYEFLKLISKVFNLNEDLITPSSIKAIPMNVNRPLNTTLNTTKINTLLKKQYSIIEGLNALKLRLQAA